MIFGLEQRHVPPQAALLEAILGKAKAMHRVLDDADMMTRIYGG